MDFLYLLHFTEPLSHARHYLGSTESLKMRLKTHQDGNGARLTQYLVEIGQTWQLAALYVKLLKSDDIRRLERIAKRKHNSTLYCPICQKGEHQAPPGTIQYPITEDTLRYLDTRRKES